ncbi:MAG TPA: hypothetical protein VEH86_06520 [Candidatus Acidoferrum sp.]|nr:hypothetical protein [Candidatus Acidoferrum sp.]
MSFSENVLLCERNRGGFSLELVARFVENSPVKYIIRIKTPSDMSADYVSSLEGFKNVGELLVALHSFAEQKLYPTDTEKLKEVLTAENIKSFVKLKKSGTFKK